MGKRKSSRYLVALGALGALVGTAGACGRSPSPQPAPKVERKLADRLRAAAEAIKANRSAAPPSQTDEVPKPRVPLITREDLRQATYQLQASEPSDARAELRGVHRFLMQWWVAHQGPAAPNATPKLAALTPEDVAHDGSFAPAQKEAHDAAQALGFTNAMHLTLYIQGLRSTDVRSLAHAALNESEVLYRQLLNALSARLQDSSTPGAKELRALLKRDPRGDTDSDMRLLKALRAVVALRERAGAELYALSRYSGRGSSHSLVCPQIVRAVYGFAVHEAACRVPVPWVGNSRPLARVPTRKTLEKHLGQIADSILVVPDPWVVPVFEEAPPAVSFRAWD